MAILRLENGKVLTDLAAIAAEFADLQIQLNHWSTGEDAQVQALLAQPSLNDVEKEQILTGLDHYFQQLQTELGYTSRDLIVLHPEVPNLDGMLAKFDKIHTHADDEVRYIVDGEGIFGFVRPDGSQMELTVQAAEYINVPAGTEHWFYLTPHRRVKAVRYFSGTEGWVPEYTGRAITMPALATTH
ncbi:MAG: cupin domain-containing protein [Synechococcales bacterium]|nr:cupin domain-containing protein [Synechococcales bacterium]